MSDLDSSSSPESLSKQNKDREYYELSNDGLSYTVEGPAEVKIFSKAAYPKKTNNELKEFGFNISINDLDIELNNSKKIDKKTSSYNHPMHLYTYASKDILVLPSGTYNIKISKKSRFNCNPILVRVLRSGRKSKNSIKEAVLLLKDKNYSVYNPRFKEHLVHDSRSTVMPLYYALDSQNPLFLNKTDDFLEINIRGLHQNVYDEYKIINMVLEKNGQLDTKYHILSIPHPSKTIAESNYIPSRLNKIYIRNQHCHEFKIQSKNEILLIKANRILN